jgi:MFS family permease
LNTLLLGRAALGLAVAGIMTGATTLVADYFTGEARNRFLGFQSAAMSLGGVVFVLLGGFLTDTGWRAPFAVYLLAFLLLPILWLALEEPLRPDKTTNTDLSAAARWPWGLLLLLYSLMLFCQVIFYLIPAQLPFHLRDLFRASGVQAGMAMGLFNFCAAVAALNYKRLKEKANYQMLFALLFSLVGLGYLLLSGATAYWQTLCSLVIAGLGFGLLIPNTNTWLLAQTPESLRGRAIGGLTTAIFLGQFLSPVLASPRGPVKTLNAVYALAGIVAAFFALCFAALRCRA